MPNKRLLADIDPIIVKVYEMGEHSGGNAFVRENTLLWAREELLKLNTKTLKEVGEWLGKKFIATPLKGSEWRIRLDEIETLKRGEMPDENNPTQ